MPFVNFPVMCELCRYQMCMETGSGEPIYRHDYGMKDQSFGWAYEDCPNWGKRYRIIESPVKVEEVPV